MPVQMFPVQMKIETVQDPNQIRKIMPVVRSAWGMTDPEQLVKDIVAAMRFHGGVVLLATEGDKTVGMHFSFAGKKGGKTYLYSHMTGVVNEKKYGGVGEQLKLRQKEWALENGYDLIVWTFDPLMSLNANFNVHKLGTIARTYLRDFYGEMEDSLNFGIPTDRFVTEWWIDREKPETGTPAVFANSPEELDRFKEINPAETVIGVYIPADYVSMKGEDHQKALRVRIELRREFEELFDRGFVVTDYSRKDCYYVLEKNEHLLKVIGGNIFR